MTPVRFFFLTISSLLIPWLPLSVSGSSQSSEMPEGFQQLLERGGIASIDDPVYVSAGEADIPSDAWVLGVVTDGESRAYSLNLLNNHEVVNDEIGGQSIAAVW
jgi:hypothetical protein